MAGYDTITVALGKTRPRTFRPLARAAGGHDIIAIAGALMASPTRPQSSLGRHARRPRPSASTVLKAPVPRPDAAQPPGPERTENYMVSPDSWIPGQQHRNVA